MIPIIHKNWATLLSGEPCLAPDVQFRVTEELSMGETMAKKTELVGAHKFILAMASDVFKDQFLAQNLKEGAEISLAGVSIESFKEFLKLLYSLFVGNWKDCTIKAEDRAELLNLCKKYEVDYAVCLIENETQSFKTGCIKQEFLTAPKESLNIEKRKGLSNLLKTREEIDDKNEIKTDLYCIMCQEYGHMIYNECISNAICISCGIKGHTRKDCTTLQCYIKKIESDGIKSENTESEEEYVEIEIAEDCLKTEERLDSEGVIKVVEQEMIRMHSLKNCSVKVKKYSNAIRKSLRKKVHTDEKPYNCPLCPRTFSVLGNMKRHKTTIHTGERLYRCPLCPKSFSQLVHMERHKRIHTCEKPYKCPLCPKSFLQSGGLDLHKRVHTGEKPYKCLLCPTTFADLSNLSKHKRIHTGEKPYKCPICPKSFSMLGNMKKHKMIHTGENLYKCPLCPKSFSQLGNMEKHKRIHTGEKPYKCPLCPKSFSILWNMERHKKIHTGEKPYECSLCSKTFSTWSHLNVHKRVHTGERPYKCTLCPKTFSQSSNLYLHKRVHTGEKS